MFDVAIQPEGADLAQVEVEVGGDLLRDPFVACEGHVPLTLLQRRIDSIELHAPARCDRGLSSLDKRREGSRKSNYPGDLFQKDSVDQ